MHPQTQSDPARPARVVSQVFTVEFAPGEEVAARLAALGVDAARIRYLINSHLHFDHTGGNAQIPNARLVVQRREWEAGHDAEQIAPASSTFRTTTSTATTRARVTASTICSATGASSACRRTATRPDTSRCALRLDSGDVMLTGDACYLRRTLEELHLPSVADDPRGAARRPAQRCARCATPARA